MRFPRLEGKRLGCEREVGVTARRVAVSGHILLVEDERAMREQLGRALERAGYGCTLAASAEAALARLAAIGHVDAVVTDVVLGDEAWRGLRLLTELRGAGRRVPIVVMMAGADVAKVKFALNAGADHLIEKPFQDVELVAAIARVLGEDEPSAAPELFGRARLTDKERTVAELLLEGRSSAEIALIESNSPRTIRQHISQIYAKCEVGSRAEFFRAVYER
jgi:DNA-binding NarL/FixJ family response regulator